MANYNPLDLISSVAGNVLNLIPSIMQIGTGKKQLRQANALEREYPLPKAEVAPAVQRAANYAYGNTLAQDIPGGGIARDEIKGATAAGLKAASELGSGAEAYGMLGRLIGGEQNQFANLAELTAQNVAGKQNTYLNALANLGQEQNRVWNWNEAEPYLRAAQIAAQLRDSGLKNKFAGWQNIFGTASEGGNDISSIILGNNSTAKRPGTIDEDFLQNTINGLLSNREKAGNMVNNLFTQPLITH